MRKKINSEHGFSLVEMLAATVILMLLALMLNTGLNMAIQSYRTITAQSEVELLLSTAVDALADDLRFAWDVREKNDTTVVVAIDVGESEDEGEGDDGVQSTVCVPFTYSSDSYGKNIQLGLDDNGRIVAVPVAEPNIPVPVLPTGAYGVNGAYRVKNMDITPDFSDNTFTIKLKVEATADGSISAETTVTVRCLNPMKVTTGG